MPDVNRQSLDPFDEKTVVCFLVINKIKHLPEIAINSLRAVSNSEIYIGYIDETDIENIPKVSGIKYLKLTQKDSFVVSNVYQDFTQSDFYSLVQYKWILLQMVLDTSRASVVVYVDLDVLWIKKPLPSIESVLGGNKYIVAIQDFTKDVSSPNLCMGFVAIKNCLASHSLLKEASVLHAQMLEVNDKVGDDDVITKMFEMGKWRDSFFLLPQSTFPVGNLANLYSPKNLYPGVSFPKPYIFHTNYVIGNQRKIDFMRLMAKQFGVPVDFGKFDSLKLDLILKLKRAKNKVSSLRK